MASHETETISVLIVECRYNYFFLWRAIDFSMTLLENVRPLTAATFGDWLSPRAQVLRIFLKKGPMSLQL